jgi:hypothetical protein
MKTLSLLVTTGLWLAALFAAVRIASSQEASNRTAMIKQSSIVFSGTVSHLSATSFADVPKSPQTIVVRVETVLRKPSAVSLKRGDTVTVEVKDPSAFQEGTQATFYTDGWIFGSGVAVKELGHEVTPRSQTPAPLAAEEKALGQAQEETADQQLKDRVASADFVVVARVTDIRKWKGPKSGSGQSRVTEHDPDWHDAVIQVESTLKGPKLKKNKLVVRYPQCNDVAWVHAPKFEKNQHGVFFLKKDEVSGQPTALLEGKEVSAYTCLRPGDWLPVSEEAHVRALLKSQP